MTTVAEPLMDIEIHDPATDELVGRVRPAGQEQVDDAVGRAVAAALAKPEAAGRTYELGGPRTYTMKELLHDACAVQIIRIASDPPVEDVESRMRVAEAPSLRAEPELSERAQDTLSRHGLSP